jgi:hypothetical protein
MSRSILTHLFVGEHDDGSLETNCAFTAGRRKYHTRTPYKA